jgi:uroporphyrin-III C-methyltransferase / precorrin-2 dehydrogenase / sirohydrochlorin ferrochelatase
MSSGAALFPLFLKLRHRKVVVVGGGPVAAAKIDALVGTGADLTVVAPDIVPRIRSLNVAILARGFLPSDLDGAWLAVAAAPPDVNRDVRAAGEARRIFVNAVDDPDSASAFTGGVLRRGGVTIAVSTAGEAPALAGLVREGLEAVVPDEVDAWVREARALRRSQRAEQVPMALRRPLLLRALNDLYAARSDEGEVVPWPEPAA